MIFLGDAMGYAAEMMYDEVLKVEIKNDDYVKGNTNKFKVIIAGSRNFNDYQTLELNCNYLLKNKLPNVEIVNGKARGADYLGGVYADNYCLDVREFPANWDKFGKSSGYIRNKEMGEYADALIAFWDGFSRGTKNMIDIMRGLGKPTKIVGW